MGDEKMKLIKPKELIFEDVAMEYIQKFNEYPPTLTTLNVNNQKYLKLLKKAIRENQKITQDELGSIFMPDIGKQGVDY